jgi:pseudouridine-5'-phosphate glycosidase/pseudouridine kinase
MNIVTPNIYELKAMFTAAQENDFFESAEWWNVLDSFNITSLFRQGVSHLRRVLM